ncbi:hypothetical protein Q2463_26240, partial [Escherichia coli]|nr:hypothetical protein [Escherichia coli]
GTVVPEVRFGFLAGPFGFAQVVLQLALALLAMLDALLDPGDVAADRIEAHPHLVEAFGLLVMAVAQPFDAGIERLRDGHHELSERFNQVQVRFYSVGGDIARVEQSIQHGQQRQRQLQDDLREAERTRQETESHLGHDRT